MEQSENEIKETCKFNIERDLNNEDREDFVETLTFLHRKALCTGELIDWEIYAINSTFYKTLYPNEQELKLDSKTYKAIDAIGDGHMEKGSVFRYLSTAASKKILYPQEWSWSQKGKDFHEDEIIWKYLATNLKYLSPKEKWEYIYPFFEFAQNLKIVSPKRFESIDLQKVIGEDIWIQDIEDTLKESSSCYSDFTLLATPMHILGYPGKIELDTLEWAEMEEEGQDIKKGGDISHFMEYSSKRKILSAKDIEITDENLNLIF